MKSRSFVRFFFSKIMSSLAMILVSMISGCGDGITPSSEKPHESKNYSIFCALKMINMEIEIDAKSLGHYDADLPDDLGRFRPPAEYMELFLGQTTGASVPGGLAPANILSPTYYVIYLVPKLEMNWLFKVTPEGVFFRDDLDQWMMLYSGKSSFNSSSLTGESTESYSSLDYILNAPCESVESVTK